MAIILSKGNKVDLSKLTPSAITAVNLGHGWDTRCDLDTCAFIVDNSGKVRDEAKDLIYFRHKSEYDGAVILDKDSTSGGSDTGGSDVSGEPDENLRVDLNALPDWVQKVVFGSWVYSGVRNFGEVEGAFADLRNMTGIADLPNTNGYKRAVAGAPVLARYNLKDFSDAKAVVLSSINRGENGKWEIEAWGIPFSTKEEMMDFFGVTVA